MIAREVLSHPSSIPQKIVWDIHFLLVYLLCNL